MDFEVSVHKNRLGGFLPRSRYSLCSLVGERKTCLFCRANIYYRVLIIRDSFARMGIVWGRKYPLIT